MFRCLIATLAILSSFACHSATEDRATELFLRATTLQVDSGHAVAAARELGQMHGPDVEALLLRIVRAEVEWSDQYVRVEAIQAVVGRQMSSAALILAGQLVPDASYVVRIAIVDALQRLGCSRDCLRLVMHYMERVWNGELPAEDAAIDSYKKYGMPQRDIEVMSAVHKTDRDTLYAKLYDLLRRNGSEMVNVLVDAYGMRSENPSLFAIQVVVDAHLREACPAMMEGQRKNLLMDPAASVPELRAAIDSLDCEERQGGGGTASFGRSVGRDRDTTHKEQSGWVVKAMPRLRREAVPYVEVERREKRALSRLRPRR